MAKLAQLAVSHPFAAGFMGLTELLELCDEPFDLAVGIAREVVAEQEIFPKTYQVSQRMTRRRRWK